ncbi:MAG: hypothetical protein CFE21_10945 [Bacteroidetes bacterium B1(2017)]|nr:MAG: hypothetical protein CFE21_10945 [Bacteroidetes bacterium B1(2017)]
MRKIALLLTAIFFLLSIAFGQQNKQDTTLKSLTVSIQSKLSVDTLRIQSLSVNETAQVWYKDENMPWIIALIISILGIIINLIISNRQIQANRETTLIQIKATLSANNRQDWVTETRNVISEVMTQAKLLNIEFQEKYQNDERKKILHEKVTMSRIKLLLLLKSDKETHKLLLASLTDLINTLDEHLLNRKAKDVNNFNIQYDNGKFLTQMDKVVENGRDLLYDEWGKIQSIADTV